MQGDGARGFTLIELLVVVAIVSLLSSVILASLNTARMQARDAKRIADLHSIRQALELYITTHGTLPTPSSYGEGSASPGFWDDWWDVSSFDKNGDGDYFLDFLKDNGLFSTVPVDPFNTPATNNPNEGYRYLYFLVPSSYSYQGGSCMYGRSNVYLLAVRDLETKGLNQFGPGCECLWQNWPGMFSDSFDYVICEAY